MGRTGNIYCCFVFNFIYLGQAKSKIWFKMWIHILYSLKQFSMSRVKMVYICVVPLQHSIDIPLLWDVICEFFKICITLTSHEHKAVSNLSASTWLFAQQLVQANKKGAHLSSASLTGLLWGFPSQRANNAKSICVIMSFWFITISYIGPCYNEPKFVRIMVLIWLIFSHDVVNKLSPHTNSFSIYLLSIIPSSLSTVWQLPNSIPPYPSRVCRPLWMEFCPCLIFPRDWD